MSGVCVCVCVRARACMHTSCNSSSDLSNNATSCVYLAVSNSILYRIGSQNSQLQGSEEHCDDAQ